ncbi:MAG: flagellar protein FlaG [Chloroflexi bacterium]|nr:flagellar protein FlaG [Chloroflexota bacterium]
MITNPLSPVNKVEIDSTHRAPIQPGESEGAALPPIASNGEADARIERVEPVKQADIRLKFLVDSQSNEVTVFIIDRASQRVLRTIPSEELTHLREGDLIELFA